VRGLGATESQGFVWDRGLAEGVLSSNGGVVAAARAALTDGIAGSLSSGLHHARADHGSGFCTFNGLAIAAHDVVEAGLVDRVLILDLDAHFGGGTASILGTDPRIWQVDVSTSPFDGYAGTSRFSPTLVPAGAHYLSWVRRALATFEAGAAAVAGLRWLCLYNAGMDVELPAEQLAARAAEVVAWSRRLEMPVAFVLAGGYVTGGRSPADLVALHRLTIEAAASCAGSGTRRKAR
jgi:acetoin utilization deacetylase AcuC-like enzyme